LTQNWSSILSHKVMAKSRHKLMVVAIFKYKALHHQHHSRRMVSQLVKMYPVQFIYEAIVFHLATCINVTFGLPHLKQARKQSPLLQLAKSGTILFSIMRLCNHYILWRWQPTLIYCKNSRQSSTFTSTPSPCLQVMLWCELYLSTHHI
jgi:hypothetical protein